VTVDRAHVLATPGMDRHGAYVALSRHRDGVRSIMAATTSPISASSPASCRVTAPRTWPATMPPSDQDRARASPSGARSRPERAREIVHQVRDKARGMFDGFRPKRREKASISDERRRPIGGKPDQAKAIERYARAAADIGRMRAKDLPVLPHQESALRKAGEALDAGRPHAARDLASALGAIPAHRAGRWRQHRRAVRAMAEEQRVRLDPERARGSLRGSLAGDAARSRRLERRATAPARSGCAATWRRWPARSAAIRSLNPRCAARPSWS
jgi:hypothetical protein